MFLCGLGPTERNDLQLLTNSKIINQSHCFVIQHINVKVTNKNNYI